VENAAQPFGLRLKKRHSALLVVHLELPNFSPRALIGAFSGATVPVRLVLTGPKTISCAAINCLLRGNSLSPGN